ncbi:hypothetical protein Dda_1178 [Drechslerella dactyloides]|uniref:Uncharacterized protein n=1 Tax=Drechslerella dactyloides TaxID=74499 RepID=A0AAD6J5Q6_DREDA|nr:hypothetical protein Dda_1178 [Drechslerella dactyloides]
MSSILTLLDRLEEICRPNDKCYKSISSARHTPANLKCWRTLTLILHAVLHRRLVVPARPIDLPVAHPQLQPDILAHPNPHDAIAAVGATGIARAVQPVPPDAEEAPEHGDHATIAAGACAHEVCGSADLREQITGVDGDVRPRRLRGNLRAEIKGRRCEVRVERRERFEGLVGVAGLEFLPMGAGVGTVVLAVVLVAVEFQRAPQPLGEDVAGDVVDEFGCARRGSERARGREGENLADEL